MKRKFLIIILGLILCLGSVGCNIYDSTHEGSKDYATHSKLISIEGEKDLYYYSTTHIVYIIFNERDGYAGYGYMSPYYSQIGKLCTYDTEKKMLSLVVNV